MQGKEQLDRQLLDAQALVGHLVPAGSMFAFLASRRQHLFGMGISRTSSRRAGAGRRFRRA